MLDPEHLVTPAAEPAYCPSCELKHSRRSDWLCPRCGMPVEDEARPRRARAASARREEGFPVGSTIAGAILAMSGMALAITFARDPTGEHRWPLVAAAVILLVLGLEALLKVSPARWVAVGAGVVAALLVAEDLVRDRLPGLTRDPLPPAVRTPLRDLLRPLYPATIVLLMGFLSGAVLLLAGRPGRVRIAVGVLLTLPLAVLQAMRALGV